MSTPRREQRDDTLPTDKPTAGAGKKAEGEEQGEPTGLEYVFKIAPADPKNSLAFEDVADK